MASPCLPWNHLWHIIWQLIPDPFTNGRLLIALDDSVNNKCGRTIFGCGFFHDHTAKLNQPIYPWSQTIVCIGLLKHIKSRWCCLPLAFRFYLMKAMIQAQSVTAQKAGRIKPKWDRPSRCFNPWPQPSPSILFWWLRIAGLAMLGYGSHWLLLV